MSDHRDRDQEQEERKRQAELAERRRQRERHLTTLAKDFDRQWKHAHSLAEGRTAATYDQALALLVDLRDAYALRQQGAEFRRKLGEFRTAYARRSALMRRLDDAGLTVSS